MPATPATDPHPSGRRKPPGFVENAIKNKASFAQLFLMTGVMLLSMRVLGQKYRIRDHQDNIANLKEENESLALRKEAIKKGLLDEAAADPTGVLMAKLKTLFADDD